MRKHIIFGVQLLFVFFAQICFSSLYAQSNMQSKLIFLEKQRFVAMTQKDTLFLQRILADDLIYTHSNALVESKKDFLQSIRTGKINYKIMESEEMTIRIFEKIAIINGIVHVVGSLNEKDFDIRLRYTDAYHKNKKGWQLETWQSVKIP